MTRILGLSTGRDAAAVLVEDGAIAAAAQEERFSRAKHHSGFPEQAREFCLGMAGGAVDRVAVMGQDVEADLCHAASAFLPSPFAEAAILVLDQDSLIARGDGTEITILERHPGLAEPYGAITEYLGFKRHSGEYKVMGLAPYGSPLPQLDLGPPPRRPDQPITAFHQDMAATIQAVTEAKVLELARRARDITGARFLCLAGEMALNCVANGKLLRAGIFDDIWVQPASGNAGGALGAALMLHFRDARREPRDLMQGGFLGPNWPQAQVEAQLRQAGARFQVLPEPQLLDRVAQALAAGKAVGWLQGRMEFGPRALGARSILADPRSPAMRDQLNLKVKFREGFRPFAPSVLEEEAATWFALDRPSPYMLLVAPVKESGLPAVTHVDVSARIQTVSAAANPRYHALLSAFRDRTGCPVLVNTSFNVRGEPMVCSPADAFRCFMGSGLDALAVGDCFLDKADQDPALAQRQIFEPD